MVRPPAVALVVADDPGVRKFLRNVLSGVSYQVLEAVNESEALRQMETAAVDLAILDLEMPEQDGVQNVKALLRVRPQIKIIALSGQFGGLPEGAADRLGAHASVTKPMQPDELLNAVARVTVGSRAAEKSKL